jgi:hypothetical protein
MELLFALLVEFANAKGHPAKAKSADKTVCTRREIQLQDCRLNSGTYKLRLLSETIARDDGTWHGVDNMPLKGEGTSWEKIQFKLFNGWPILQMWIWDKPAGEANVQQLHWYVGDVRNQTELQVLATGVVRRRRAKNVEVAEGKPAPKPVYTLDAMEPHNLKLRKDGRLDWSLGSEKKILDKGTAILPTPSKPEGEEEHKAH